VDITERKQAEVEREKLEAQNRQLRKSKSLGRMAGAIAHHFNNQLQVVMMNLDFAIRSLSSGEVQLENLLDAMQSARKAAEMSSLMQTYLGQTFPKRELLDLSDVCRRNLPMLRATLPKDVMLEADLPTTVIAMHADANQIHRILANLVTNAWECDKRTAIRLTARTVSPADIAAANRFPIGWQPQSNAYGCLQVADTGCGIAAEDIENLFDPFYSTKFIGRGMGLPEVLGIVCAHEGVVTVESELGRGSVFTVFLPVTEQAMPQKPGPMAQAPGAAWTGTVLIVDDEVQLLKGVATAIQSMGFKTLTAREGIEAVQLFQQHQKEVRLVICDLTLPGMDGWKILTVLRKLAPGIPVILTSGYDESRVMGGYHPELPQLFLSKPYELEMLRDAVSHVMANRS
jgi:nitrogen-specific signal transduction histidine kinase